MKYYLILLMFINLFSSCDKEGSSETDPLNEAEVYFPPNNGDEWETKDPSNLNWDLIALEDLYSFLEESETRAFIILKDGNIVVEKYWNKGLLNQKFTLNSNWYWASAAKSMTSFLIGQAVSEGIIDIEKSSQEYLGPGWSSLSDTQEKEIKVRDHLAMTTGLDDSGDVFCTDPECLNFKAAPGSRWAYHNGPYTILDRILDNASTLEFDGFFETTLKDKIGMDGFWMYQDFNHLYFSTARSMARFGLLMLNQGRWSKDLLISEQDFLQTSISPSQDLNPSYGYLWWLNGQSSIMLPGSQTVFNNSLSDNAPADMFAAMGKNSQLINVVPSQDLVLIRMGADPDDSLVPTSFQDRIWEHLKKVIPE